MEQIQSRQALMTGLLVFLFGLGAACGAEGPRGAMGPNGADGAAGSGANGADGAAGADGADGSNGIDGSNGANGADWPGPPPAEYLAADGLAGGAAFSKWYHADGGGIGSQTNYGVTVGTEFVRCKTCHGWDGAGNAGSYADRTGQSTGAASRPDVSSTNLRVAAASSTHGELFDLIAAPYGRPLNSHSNSHPDFTAALTNAQIWNLIKFMKEEWVNPNELYDLDVAGPSLHYEYSAATTSWVLVKPTLTYSNIGKDGNAINGAAVYATKCQGCHGATGMTVLLETGTMSLGEFIRAKPHEAWFKIKFGTQGAMAPGLVTTTADLKHLYKLLADAGSFPDQP